MKKRLSVLCLIAVAALQAFASAPPVSPHQLAAAPVTALHAVAMLQQSSPPVTIQFISVPSNATYTADYMAHQFASVLQSNEALMQNNAKGVFGSACGAWLVNAQQDRNLGLPLPTKPAPPLGTIFTFSYSAPGSVETLTILSSQAPITAPCPDLPPPAGSGANFVLGPLVAQGDQTQNPGSAWFLVGPGDTEPLSVYFVAPDGHTYMKVQFLMGTQEYYRQK